MAFRRDMCWTEELLAATLDPLLFAPNELFLLPDGPELLNLHVLRRRR
jgi:hypothetical protein